MHEHIDVFVADFLFLVRNAQSWDCFSKDDICLRFWWKYVNTKFVDIRQKKSRKPFKKISKLFSKEYGLSKEYKDLVKNIMMIRAFNIQNKHLLNGNFYFIKAFLYFT